MFLKTLKFIFISVIGIIAIAVIGSYIVTNLNPAFGLPPEGSDLERMKESPNFQSGEFQNLIETQMGTTGDMLGTLPDFFNLENGEPKDSLPVLFGENQVLAPDSVSYITWYGHSAFLIEIQSKKILIDPMLGDYASPFSFGSKRFPYKKPIPIEELTDIDAVIISHDHYDHLDYPTINLIKQHVGRFYTPLGVGSHLKYWGIPENKVTELDWWEETEFDDIKLAAVPARHFSGRGVTDRNSTQWASWIIEGDFQKIYFSGDGGYGPHFKDIGDKYGPFDFAMLECGQYNEAWEAIHMMPEQSVIAGKDLNAKLVMPIHWGAFQLSIHSWTDPILRFKSKSEEQNVPMVHPIIGERFGLGMDYPRTIWWDE